MTGIDGAATATYPFQDQTYMDQPLPDVLATLEAEYFVEWQVADLAPQVRQASREANPL